MNTEQRREAILKRTSVVCVGAFICCFLWGSAFPGIKLGYAWMNIASQDAPSQILYGGVRFIVAGVLAILIGSLAERKPMLPTREALPSVFVLSLFQTVLQYVFFYVGLAHTSGVKASIIEGVNVFVAIFVSAVLFRLEKITGRKLFGSVVGFAGVVLINITGTGLDTSLSMNGEGFIFFSTVAYAFSSVCLKYFSVKYNPVMLSGAQFVVGGAVMTLIGILTGGNLAGCSAKGIVMLFYLACVSAIAYSLWAILLKYNSVSKVAVFGFMNPVIGVILSALLLQEGDSLGLKAFVSLALVCVGIAIVNGCDSKKKEQID